MLGRQITKLRWKVQAERPGTTELEASDTSPAIFAMFEELKDLRARRSALQSCKSSKMWAMSGSNTKG